MSWLQDQNAPPAQSVEADLREERKKNTQLLTEIDSLRAQRSMDDKRIRELSEQNAKQASQVANVRDNMNFLMQQMLQHGYSRNTNTMSTIDFMPAIETTIVTGELSSQN